MPKQVEILSFYPEDELDLELNGSLPLDIIAIHGLNGNQLNTWTEPKSQKLWLRDFLPGDVKARVLAFGYDATAAFGNGVAGIEEHARGLLGGLVEKRARSFEAKRPLIFIGHSLGGLVIKQALVIAEQETPYKQIYSNTLGIMFFGTPHQGSSLANYAAAITRYPLVLANKPNAELLETLRKDSPALKKLWEDWTAHHERRPYDVVSFYETRAMKVLGGLIVEKTSALLTPPGEKYTWEQPIPVTATHREMCRFATPKDGTYQKAVRAIKRIQQGSEINVKHEHYVVTPAVNTYFTGRDEIREKLYDSLLPNRTSKTQQRFVLYGLGGSGKTQIALKFAADNRYSFWGIFWIDVSSEETTQASFLHAARVCNQDENVESFKAWLSRNDHWLLILDNADDPDFDISKFFPARERGTILITTRNPDLHKYQTAGTYCVEQLCSRDAVGLLLKTAAIEDVQKEEARPVAEKIVNELGCLALAIIQAGAVVRQGICDLDGFCDLYSERKIEVLESGRTTSNTEEYKFSVFTTWEISIRQIQKVPGEDAELALELLGIFSFMHFSNIQKELFKSAVENSRYSSDIPGFRGTVLAKLMPEGWNSLLWGKAMKLLLGFSLITTSHSGLISMHPLVHLWSRERLSVAKHATTWKTALMTLSMSTTGNLADEQSRRALLPHLDSLFGHGDGEFTVPVIQDMGNSYRATWNFHLAYTEGGQYQKALKLVQADLKAHESILDTKDERYLSLISLTGVDLYHLGRYGETKKLLEPLLKRLPENGPSVIAVQTVICLAASYNHFKEYQAAYELCTKTIARFEGLSEHDPYASVLLYDMIRVALSGLKRPKEALIWSRKALVATEKRYGAGNSRIAKAMGSVAANYADLNDLQKACGWQEKCVNALRNSLGDNHPDTISAEECLVNYTACRGMSFLVRKRLVSLRKMRLDKLSRNFGDRDLRTLMCRASLAQDYFYCGWLKKAMRMQEEWVDVMIQEFGADDRRTIEGIAELATTRRWMKTRKALYWWLPEKFLR